MTALLVGLACFALHAVVTLIWLRLQEEYRRLRGTQLRRSAHTSSGSQLATLVVGPFAYWPAAAANGFLAIGWLFAFSAVYKSVSLRILTHLDRVLDHSLTVDAIAEQICPCRVRGPRRVLMKMGCVDDPMARTH